MHRFKTSTIRSVVAVIALLSIMISVTAEAQAERCCFTNRRFTGICEVVPEGFWDSTRDIMQEHFRKGHFKEGIIAGVLSAGKELKAHFPWHPEDPNELSDEISRS